MPLMLCQDCGSSHSDAAACCPKCGRPNKAARDNKNKPTNSNAKESPKPQGCLTGCVSFVLLLMLLGLAGSLADSIKSTIVKSFRLQRLFTQFSPSQQIRTSPTAPTFVPGVPGRPVGEACNTTTQGCQQWTDLARKCEENMRALEAGDFGRKSPYCSQAENLRERLSGIEDSSAPGAYRF